MLKKKDYWNTVADGVERILPVLGVRVFLSQCFQTYLDSLGCQNFGLSIPFPVKQIDRDIVVACGGIRMVFAERCLPDFQCLPVQRFGLAMAVLSAKIGGDVVIA